METKHTKGEWKAVKPNNSQIFISSEYHGAICQLPREYGGVDGIEEAEANAKLISAAPDLLKSILELKEMSERKIEPTEEEFNEADLRLNAAIKKATE